jgi:hypothetical protein
VTLLTSADDAEYKQILFGQLLVGNLADRKGRSYAMFLNSTNSLISSIFTLFACSYFFSSWFSRSYCHSTLDVQSRCLLPSLLPYSYLLEGEHMLPHSSPLYYSMIRCQEVRGKSSALPINKSLELIRISSGVAFYYSTGAIVTLCQAAGAALVTPLLKHSNALPCVVSIICCLLA